MAGIRYRLVFLASFLGLLWERLWNRFWLAFSVTLFFVALVLLNLPLFLGAFGPLLMLAVYAIALALSLINPPAPFSFPSRTDIERHMERVSHLDHRPLQTLHDAPAEGLSEDAQSLWQKHLEKTTLVLRQLKVYRPQPTVTRCDRWRLRYIALVLFALGLAVAQADAPERLKLALMPDMSALVDKQTIALDLWITPPEYTHEATLFLSTAKQGLVAHDALAVPAGSILKLRLSGLRFAPRITYAGQKYALTEAAPRNFTLEVPLQESGTLRLSSFLNRLGQWPLTVLPDTAPDVSISKIEPTPRATVKITYKANDDHGLTSLTGIVGVDGSSYAFNMPVSSSVEETSFTQDLASNPSAGAEAVMWLEAEDAMGHKTDSVPVSFVLPERTFTNPTAQRIATERKILLHAKDILSRRSVVEVLTDIVEKPALYKGDLTIFMSLNSAIKRLIYDGGDEAASSTAAMLWDVALKLEDGGLTFAQRDLHEALQKLSDALNDKSTTKQQLQELVDAVKQKMQQYVQSLAAEIQQKLQQGQKMPVMSPELAQQFMKNLDINKLLQQMQQLNQANSREDLQKMADNLKNSIDNLDMNKFQQMQEKQAKAMQALQNLQDIIHRQQSLFDKTNKTDDPADMKDMQHEQAAIRTELGDSLHKLGETGAEIPDNFAKADQAMKASGAALGKGQSPEALAQQKTALDEMQKGLDNTVKKMAQAMQQSILSFGAGGSSFGEGLDPLGRENGTADDSSVKIPDEKEQRRVQEIIEELRHRSNEPNRTKVERDYIDRLLDQF